MLHFKKKSVVANRQLIRLHKSHNIASMTHVYVRPPTCLFITSRQYVYRPMFIRDNGQKKTSTVMTEKRTEKNNHDNLHI